MHFKSLPLLTPVLLLLTAPALAQDAPAPKPLAQRLAAIERRVEARREALHVPGAALAIVKDGQVIALKGFGFRDAERRLPVTADTLFAIGSSTKAFTAMTVLQAADAGKLAMTDSPKKYLPYFKLQDPEADAKITIGDLLSHRSGLDRTDLSWYTGVLSTKEAIQVAGLAKPSAKLGEKFLYQNVMYAAAGEIAATLAGKPWPEVVTRSILRPLGMRSTNLSVPRTLKDPDHALGYNWNEERKQFQAVPMRDIRNVAPAGAINSSARDMAEWVKAMLARGAYPGGRLISDKLFDELFVKRNTVGGPVGYGYGWFLREWRGHKVMEHGGNIDGFNAQVALMPDQKLGMVLLTNISNSPLTIETMGAVWANLVDGAPAPALAAGAGSTASLPMGPDAAKEAGTYNQPQLKMAMQVTLRDGKLTVTPTGQPEMPLSRVGDRRYQIGPPAPPSVFISFRPVKEKPEETELVLEQSGATFVFGKEKPAEFQAPITVKELMRKVVDAQGGEANLARHRTRLEDYAVEMPQQGMAGAGTRIWRAPNAVVDRMKLTAAGKTVLRQREFFNGKQGGSWSTFAPYDEKSGKALDDLALACAFAPDLSWKTLFKTVTIKKMEKVGDEEAYVVEKTPEKGRPITDYISTKSFLLLRRDSSQSMGPGLPTITITTTYSDYRPVDGVVLPFTSRQTAPSMGETVVRLKRVRFDVKVKGSTFTRRGG
jgi:CubicO group peptidase (beta-lactamase class C family)